jgi:hypothetical protein
MNSYLVKVQLKNVNIKNHDVYIIMNLMTLQMWLHNCKIYHRYFNNNIRNVMINIAVQVRFHTMLQSTITQK